MFSGLTKIALNIILILTLVFVVSACGRRGALELPPSSSVVKSDVTGEVVEEKPVEDEPFILDSLL